jgi:hypothetical protein
VGAAVQEADQDRAETTEQLKSYELGQLQEIEGARECLHLIMIATIYSRKLRKNAEIQTIGIV